MKLVLNHLKLPIRSLLYSARPQICKDIAVWAKEYGIPTVETLPPVLQEVEPHISDDTMAEQCFHYYYDALCRPQVLVPIEKAVVRDTIGLVQLPDGQVCAQGNWHLPYLEEHPSYRRRYSWRWQHLDGNIYSLLCWWGQEFYHWFHDVLPRLEFVLSHLPADTKFLIQDQARPYQLDSLCAYGIGSDKLVLQPIGVYSKIERLWFASPVGHTGLGSSSALKAVAQRLTSFFDTEDRDTNLERIYISRSKAKTRRILNEELLKPVLRDHGFSIYTCEDLSLKEQVQLFSRAEAIIGSHGAGLTNMIYALCGTPVAEVITDPAVHYIMMARQLGHRFSRLKAIVPDDNEFADMCLASHDLESWLGSLSKPNQSLPSLSGN